MRIVSKFVDFYDSMARYGQDLTRVWLRSTTRHWYGGARNNKEILDLHPELESVFQKARAGVSCVNPKEAGFHNPSLVIIAFAGRAYPLYINDYTGYENFIAHRDSKAMLTTWTAPEKFKLRYSSFGDDASTDNVARYYTEIAPTLTLSADVFLYYQSPILLLSSTEHAVITNPQLKSFLFQTQMDVATFWQKLEQYLYNDMTIGDVYPPSQMTDKEKVLSHGFDLKYGFRKRPR